jgi:hypothetical protein
MNAFASLYVGFGAIQIFTALSFGLLARRSVLAKAQASFGWIAVMLGISSLLQFAELRATSPNASATWQSLVFASHLATLLVFTPFARTYLELEDEDRNVRRTYWVIGATMLPILAGFAYDPSHTVEQASRFLPGPERPLVKMTGFGLACAILGFVGYAIVWAPGAKKLLRAPIGRELPAVMSVTSVAYTADFFHYALGIRAVPLAPIAAIFFSLAMSAIILGKYLEVRSSLERHTSELRLRYDQIALIETEIGKKEPLAIVGELSGVIARQIQAPVATLREACADLRIESLSPEDREQALGHLDRETSRLNRLISDLLTYARPIEPQFEMVNVLKLWERALAALEQEKGTRLRVEMDLADDVVNLEGDLRLLRDATLLLLENAAKVLAERDLMRVEGRLYEEGGRQFLRMEFRDSGGWIAAMARSNFSAGRRMAVGGEIDALELGIIDKIITAHEGSFLFEKRPDGDLVGVALFPLRASSNEAA